MELAEAEFYGSSRSAISGHLMGVRREEFRKFFWFLDDRNR